MVKATWVHQAWGQGLSKAESSRLDCVIDENADPAESVGR
jgi:hypothetical protein